MNDAFRVISFLLSAPLQEEISYITFSPHSSSILLFYASFFSLYHIPYLLLSVSSFIGYIRNLALAN
jgi:hypothetical protein